MSLIKTTNPWNIYEFLPEMIRAEDESQDYFVRRWFEGFQDVSDELFVKIYEMYNLFSPENCPAAYLEYLRWLVGFNSQLDHINNNLAETETRKLISIAFEIWNKKTTWSLLKELLEFFTGQDVLVFETFNFYFVIDQSLLGYPEFYTGEDDGSLVIHIEDVYSTHNQVFLSDLAELIRPIKQEWTIIYYNFMELWNGELENWTETGTVDIQTVTDHKYAYLRNSSSIEASISGVSANWTNYLLFSWLKFTGAGYVTIKWFITGATYFYLKIGENSMEFGSSTAIYGTVSRTLHADIYYGFWIDCQEHSLGKDIKIYHEGDLVFEFLNWGSEPSIDAGTISYETDANTELHLRRVELKELS